MFPREPDKEVPSPSEIQLRKYYDLIILSGKDKELIGYCSNCIFHGSGTADKILYNRHWKEVIEQTIRQANRNNIIREISEEATREGRIIKLIEMGDLVSSVWIEIFSQLRRDIIAGKQINDFRAWRNMLIHNVVKDIADDIWEEKRKMLFGLLDDLEMEEVEQCRLLSDAPRTPYQIMEERELLSRTQEACYRLSDKERRIIELYYNHEVSTEEIAEREGISQSTVQWHLRESRKKLRKELTKKGWN